MVNILLVGCNGKMGNMISKVASTSDTLKIQAGVDMNTETNFDYSIYDSIDKVTEKVDVILDFSRPSSLDAISKYALNNSLPVVFCTTGYTAEQIAHIKELQNSIPVFFSANMSIGINIINNLLKSISNKLYMDFDIEIIEKHHNQKVDAPSGTALLLANTIKDSIDEETTFNYGREGISKREHKEIGIHAIRGGNIIGDHEVIFAGMGEVIEIKHSAISREVFAVGALKACEYVHNKPKGLYSMDDVVK
ncbi:4-hydroxy-tetrahydrodipicolinate reductase [Clostridium sp. UBA1056]|uniref:4-hydroxy-tetrahydrodipicolinate reductase n=1 Tax=unclassified Clostridium TaxID=2614128 RepID=UPI00321725A8